MIANKQTNKQTTTKETVIQNLEILHIGLGMTCWFRTLWVRAVSLWESDRKVTGIIDGSIKKRRYKLIGGYGSIFIGKEGDREYRMEK